MPKVSLLQQLAAAKEREQARIQRDAAAGKYDLRAVYRPYWLARLAADLRPGL